MRKEVTFTLGTFGTILAIFIIFGLGFLAGVMAKTSGVFIGTVGNLL